MDELTLMLQEILLKSPGEGAWEGVYWTSPLVESATTAQV